MSGYGFTAGSQNVATDVKGNITKLPANLRPSGSTTAMNLTWDSDNKLRSVDIDANGTADVNFQYDALERRVARTGTGGSVVYVQMDQQTIADYPVGGAATTPTFRYVYGSYIDEPVVRKTAGTGGTLVYFHRNHQYSVTAITTSAGAISERYAYTAYGQPTILNASGTVISATTLSNRFTYTGREWDATLGLHHFRARWMSPNAGRFLGRDPIGYGGSAWGLNEFLDSNPPRSIDPTGLATTVTWVGTKCVTINLPGTLTCTCGSKGGMNWGIQAAVTAAFQVEFPGVKVTLGGGITATSQFIIGCGLPDCPRSCACGEIRKCDRKQEKQGRLKICADIFRVQTDPIVICIPPVSLYDEEHCFTIWPGSSTTVYAYSSHNFEEKTISDFGECECVKQN